MTLKEEYELLGKELEDCMSDADQQRCESCDNYFCPKNLEEPNKC